MALTPCCGTEAASRSVYGATPATADTGREKGGEELRVQITERKRQGRTAALYTFSDMTKKKSGGTASVKRRYGNYSAFIATLPFSSWCN